VPAPIVLIIDDDQDFCFLLRSALTRAGAVAESAGSAFGLVARAAGLTGPRPDVIVLDCDLPALAGTSALALLAKNSKAQAVPVVVLSAALQAAIEPHLAGHGNACFITKDGRFPALAAAILEKVGPKKRESR